LAGKELAAIQDFKNKAADSLRGARDDLLRIDEELQLYRARLAKLRSESKTEVRVPIPFPRRMPDGSVALDLTKAPRGDRNYPKGVIPSSYMEMEFWDRLIAVYVSDAQLTEILRTAFKRAESKLNDEMVNLRFWDNPTKEMAGYVGPTHEDLQTNDDDGVERAEQWAIVAGASRLHEGGLAVGVHHRLPRAGRIGRVTCEGRRIGVGRTSCTASSRGS
jgi:hypothetical protein